MGETTEEEALYTANTIETKISVREHGLIKKSTLEIQSTGRIK